MGAAGVPLEKVGTLMSPVSRIMKLSTRYPGDRAALFRGEVPVAESESLHRFTCVM